MEKKIVRHHDYDVVELLEGEVDKYFTRENPDRSGKHGYGFVKLDSGVSLFFHVHQLSTVDAYEVEKMKFIPRFQGIKSSLRDPAVKDRIFFVTENDPKGRLRVGMWTYPLEYEGALLTCDTLEKLERTRIERNPNFKCLEIRQPSCGPASSARIVFQGTKEQFEQKYPLHKFNRFEDPILSESRGDTDYIRWFERETITHDWVKCDDPRKTRLQVTIQKAREILWACDRRVVHMIQTVWWNAPVRRLTYVMDDTKPLVAIGKLDTDNKRTIVFKESPDYLETTFTSGDLQFEELWRAGHLVPSEQPVVQE